MPTINGQPINNTVQYQGKTLPQDATEIGLPTVDPNVPYEGKNLPSQAIKPIKILPDPTNNPSAISLGPTTDIQYLLPASINIIPNGEKILAESQIIDGVSVFEHINRKPYEIDLKIMIFDATNTPVFPQEQIKKIWSNIWLPDTVMVIKNTFLNSLNINQVIVKSIKTQPRLGSKIVDMVIKIVENQQGQSIIIPHGAIVINF